MKCQQCQTQLNPKARFCPHCGALVETPKPATTEEDALVEEMETEQKLESGSSPADATVRVSPMTRRKAHSWAKSQEAVVPPVRPEPPATQQPEAVSSSKQGEIQGPTSSDDKVNKLIIPEQPPTEIELDALHLYASVPLPQAPATHEHFLSEELPTQPISIANLAHPELHAPTEQQSTTSQAALSPLQQSPPLLYYKLNTTTKGSQMLPAVINSAYSQGDAQRRKRSKGGCILGCLTTLVLLLVILGAGWIFILRPYAHNIAQTELDKAMTSAVDQMPTSQLTQLLPPGSKLPINESTINNLIVLNLAPSDPVQKPATSITPQRVRIAFEVYGYPSAISMVPALDSNGHLVANNVNVEGVLGFIMSPDELKPLLDKHLSDAQNKLGRAIKAVKLDNQQLSFTL